MTSFSYSPAPAVDEPPFPTGTRVGVVCDFIEDNWVSMNYVADMLIESVAQAIPNGGRIERIRPAMAPRFTLIPGLRTRKVIRNADQLLNRFRYYPRYLKTLWNDFDLFHIVDHSYAQLANALPPGRCIVTCHDVDAFKALIDPDPKKHHAIHRAMAGRQLDGLRRAAIVGCVSDCVRDQILKHRLVPEARLRVVRQGVHPSCTPFPEAVADSKAVDLLGRADPSIPEILHVSSTVPRKRIDLLLKIFAGIRVRFPNARLIRAGGRFTAGQEALAEQLSIGGSIRVLPFVDRETLAAVYRRSALVLHPSQSEGFGLPVIEALACGAIVIASDLPVLREAGGDSVTYAPVGQIDEWTETACRLLEERTAAPELREDRRRAGIRRASTFTWPAYAVQTIDLYREALLKISRSGPW